MSCSNRRTRTDFRSGRLSSVLANGISIISRPPAGFATHLSGKFLRRPRADHVNGLADFVGGNILITGSAQSINNWVNRAAFANGVAWNAFNLVIAMFLLSRGRGRSVLKPA